mmetsp:Transcript_18547/g.40140  ORF Transcript_18547/g.40140 Transcript_18547/m.40140 type:complete len:615 (-) Transcript_18547:359-2203(-)|eukprot:CAMPEP_0172304324 /NCGR_PEP_ID=MMETSP1058-20130122/5745_1 /TAXON_ID=83371 /ORGANISM="Detonula confervacea, Strain CCMP 353" /LENGTH=614 /DNA_ID=CAMNT_0013015503 /DNA_START=49 /DNA_END=1893 /DNA_ORIENTATION=+
MATITILNGEDVICGRGGIILKQPGNSIYRKLVCLNKELYATCPKSNKTTISKRIVAAIRENNGRFLEREDGRNSTVHDEKDENGNPVTWRDIGDKRATEKTSQALREGQSKLLKKLAQQLDDMNPLAMKGLYNNNVNVGVGDVGVAPPQSQAMSQLLHSTVQENSFNRLPVQGGVPMVGQVQPQNTFVAQHQKRPRLTTASSLNEAPVFSAFPQNKFVENNTTDPSRAASDSNSSWWTDRIEEIMEYKMDHGHVDVPPEYGKNVPLGKFVKKQRSGYQSCKKNKNAGGADVNSSLMDVKEKINNLEGVGFMGSEIPTHLQNAQLEQRRESKKRLGNEVPKIYCAKGHPLAMANGASNCCAFQSFGERKRHINTPTQQKQKAGAHTKAQCPSVNLANKSIQIDEASASSQILTDRVRFPASLEAEDGVIENNMPTQTRANTITNENMGGAEGSGSGSGSDPLSKAFYKNLCEQMATIVATQINIQNEQIKSCERAREETLCSDVTTKNRGNLEKNNSNPNEEMRGKGSDSDPLPKAFYKNLCEVMVAKIKNQEEEIKLLKRERTREETLCSEVRPEKVNSSQTMNTSAATLVPTDISAPVRKYIEMNAHPPRVH